LARRNNKDSQFEFDDSLFEEKTEKRLEGTEDETEPEQAKPGLKFYLGQSEIFVNLIVMIINWTTSCFCFYLVSFEL